MLGILTFLVIGYIFCLPRQLFHVPYSTVVTDRNDELLGARIASDGQWRFPPRETTPEKIKCRDNKLFDETLLRENMENYFAMGGCDYLDNRRFDEPQTTVDDAVCGIASIMEALQASDNDRFHMETLYHSEKEIEMLLRRGKKIETGIQIMVDDEEEEEQEYQSYHGFGMGGMSMW